MNKYKKFALCTILIEIVLIIICNVYILKNNNSQQGRKYLVDISRIVTRVEKGESIQNIDLNKYKTIVSIKEFDPYYRSKYDYTVEELNGKLYRFEYYPVDNSFVIWHVNKILTIMLVFSIVLLAFVGKKIIYPFISIKTLPQELAKGNLSIPIKEEKSKFFGSFLWGMDMLREKLEDDKRNELELIKERKTLILSLSHDIKTPLSAIDLYARALKNNLYKEEKKKIEALEGIEKNVFEIKKYVNEILEAARKDFLSLSVENTEVYLFDVIKEIEKYYTEKMMHLHIDFKIFDTDNCFIYGDFNRIVEVFQNVIENAVKYGDGKKIEISFSEEEECRLITVSNTGCSVKQDEIPHLFDSFYRGSNSEGIQGSGLGLYICKEIMKKMDGDIFAEIKGDIFAVTLVTKKL
ncbi:sensor histidine kinase [Butyrivibrio sp. NC3005]|uniref:sensor histidine kinase n=1 Tax=Butyrivibrio sp. NC3005 TaxID=1280685 RepID=UPI00040F1202|nr:HAMP domain-containing sensor histidine kinase [Butyrivibrio sp. NC3005]